MGGQVRHNLHRGGASPNHPDAFPLESAEHRPVGASTGISVVPPGGVKHVAAEAPDPRGLRREPGPALRFARVNGQTA